MDTSRISLGERIAAASGLVLLIAMFLPWYRVSADIDRGAFSTNAWQSFGLLDFVLFIVALLAIGVAVARAAGAMPPDLPAPPGQILLAAGGLATLFILFRLIDTPVADIEGLETSRKLGAFIGLLAAAGVTFGGYTAMTEEGAGAPRRTRR